MRVEPYVLILDTGPLWELVLYRAVNALGFYKLRTELRHLATETYYDRLSQFIAGFRQRTTTPQIVSEISSRVMRTERQGHIHIWDVVYNEFAALDERLVKLLEMPQALVAQFGAADVSILKLGSTYPARASVVLSIDSSLIAECQRAGLTAQHLWEVIAD